MSPNHKTLTPNILCAPLLVKIIALVGVIFTSHVGWAFEVIIQDPGPSIKNIHTTNIEPTLPLATTADVVCGKAHHMVRFRMNDKHAGLSFSISAKKMTRVKIRWDHPDKVLFPFPEKKKTITFPHSGGESRFYFRAYEPISGNVYILNDKDVVIKSCPYSFLSAKRFRQSISVNVNETQYDRANSTSNDDQNNASVDYRISSKSIVPGGSYWSFRIGVSQSESSTDSHRVSSGFSINW